MGHGANNFRYQPENDANGNYNKNNKKYEHFRNP